VYDARYYGGQCETIYNGEWRELRYDPACERLYYGDDEKYFRKPYNFLKYHFEVSLNSNTFRLLWGEAWKEIPVSEDALLRGFAGD
jgi:complement component 8 subunit alpha